jgi:4-hydroxy-3-polyprenylbenzoate decarboxylase
LGTWHINVTNDSETQQRNVGVYRMQLLDAKRATVSTSPQSHLGMQVAKAEQSGTVLPMAVAIGVPETTVMAAAASFNGADEYALAGALQQEPLKLVKCSTVDLEVPACSEIVVEGFIQPGERAQDGPYLDYAGVPNTNSCAFVFEATALSYRDNPVFRGTSIGQPGAEDHQLFAALADVGLLDFHGRRIKQKVQNFLLRRRSFQTFQLVGRLSNPLS